LAEIERRVVAQMIATERVFMAWLEKDPSPWSG